MSSCAAILRLYRRSSSFLLLIALWAIPTLCNAQLSQTITFTKTPPPQANAGTTVVLAATATSGLPVNFTVASGPARVSGTNGEKLTFVGVGMVVVEANQSGGNGYSAAPPVKSSPANVTVLTEPVNTVSPAVDTVITFSRPGRLDRISAVTQGAANLDFTRATNNPLSSPLPCAEGTTYTSGQICSLRFNFKPTRPGIRYGGLVLTDSTGSVLANSYIYGYGVGPQIVYEPIQQSFIGNSLGQPSGVAINGRGDLFVSNYLGTGFGLVQIAVNGTVAPIGNITDGRDVAVDGAGNVFVVTVTTLYEVMAAADGTIPASPEVRTLATGFEVYSGGIAIDGSGNAYIANGPKDSSLANPQGNLYELEAVDGLIPANASKLTIGPIFPEPTGVAVDSSGNAYVSDGLTPAVIELMAVNGRVPTSPATRTIGSGYVSPSNIRLDNTNDIFISDTGVPGVIEFQAVTGVVATSAKPKLLGTNFRQPQGLLVDGAGNLFVADAGYPQVVKLNYSAVPTLTFAPTLVGQTSADSPQLIKYTNAGNADLVFTPPTGAGKNPGITTNFTIGTSSTCPQLSAGDVPATLAVGQTCTDAVSFTPTAPGPITGTLVTVDNDLGLANATQVVHLNGTGTLKTPVIVFNLADRFVDDPPFPVTATSDSPAPFTYTVVNGPALVSGSTVTLSGTPGTVVIRASQSQSIPYGAGTFTAGFNVVKHSQTISFAPLATPVLPTAAPITLVASATSGLPVTFSIVSGPGTISGSTLLFTGYGTIVVAADQPGNAKYDAAPRVIRQTFVLDNRVAVSLAGAPNAVFLKNPVSFAATATSPGSTPTGTITFMDGAQSLATVGLNGTVAGLITSALPLGLHTITAVYNGDTTFAPAVSNPVTILVSDFSLTITNPEVTISHGGTGVFNLVITTVGGTAMASNVEFSATGTPDRSDVAFSPSQVATGSGKTSFTLTIKTPNYPVGPWILGSFILGFLGLRNRRRKLSRLTTLFLAIALSAAVFTLNGCGSGWKTQNFPITITATSGALSHTVTAKLISHE